MTKKTKISNKGFTLIEMLVALFIFSSVFSSISALFVSGIRAQSRTLASQQILREASYVIEYMGRTIRVAQKDDIEGVGGIGKDCLLGDRGVNYATTTRPGGEIGIRFRNYKDQCQEFYRECGDGVCRLKEEKAGSVSYLTSPNLNVAAFNITGSGWQQPPFDLLQPRVTIFLEIKRVGPEPQPRVRIQTTISQRNPDVQE